MMITYLPLYSSILSHTSLNAKNGELAPVYPNLSPLYKYRSSTFAPIFAKVTPYHVTPPKTFQTKRVSLLNAYSLNTFTKSVIDVSKTLCTIYFKITNNSATTEVI